MSTVLDQLRAKTAQSQNDSNATRIHGDQDDDQVEHSRIDEEHPLQRAWDTAQAGDLVQQRVSGLQRKDRRSVWSGLFTRHRITAKQRSALRASLLKTFTTRYRCQIRTEIETLGYPRRQIALTDPRVKQTLAGLAGEHATLVQRTYNRLLEGALAQLPPDATQHDINQAIASQISQARQYTSDVLVPYLQGRVSDQAQRDFYTQNQIDASWELDHPVSHQPPDETCQEARARSGRGAVDTAYRAQTPMPNHRHCQGRWRAKPAPGATLPPPEQLWDGDVTHALLEAKNQGLICKVARRYPLTPIPQLQSRYQTLLLALDEIRRSPVVYSWLKDRVLLDLAAIQLEATLQGYPEALSEQLDAPPLLLAVEEIDPTGGAPLDDPRNHQASQPVLVGDIIPGETLRGEVITKARVHAEQERLSLAWDPIKHPRGEHGHFATVDTHLDRMPESFRAKIDRRLDSLGIHQGDMEKHLYDLAMHALGTHNPARDTEFQKARDYFPSVHRFAEHLATTHGISLEHAAGVIAALSPRRKWTLPLDAKNLDNQAAASRLLDLITRERSGFQVHVSRELALDFNLQGTHTDPAGKAISSDSAETGPMREGTYQLRDLSPMKAAHVAHALGYKLSAAAGHVPVARAIAIARTGNVETHLQGPKVRSFYNNIVMPGQTGDATIDTHVLRAALNEHAITVGGKAYASAWDWEKEKKSNTFQNLLFKINGTNEGLGDHTGAYSVVRDAVARVGAEFRLTPDEMQSLIWRESQRKYLGVDPDTAHISAHMLARARMEYDIAGDWERSQASVYASDVPKSASSVLAGAGVGTKAMSGHALAPASWEELKHPRGEHGHFTSVPHEIETHPLFRPLLLKAREDVAALDRENLSQTHHMMGEFVQREYAEHGDRIEAYAVLRALDERAARQGEAFTPSHELVSRSLLDESERRAEKAQASAPTHRVTEIERGLQEGIFKGEMLALENQGINRIYHAEIAHQGQTYQAVVKPERETQSTLAHSSYNDLGHERAAYLVNEAMGHLVDVPETVLRDSPRGRAMVQRFVEGEPYEWKVSQSLMWLKGDEADNIALFDAVIANRDRHAGNILVTGSRGEMHYVAIDHGIAFEPTESIALGKIPVSYPLTTEQKHALGALIDAIPRLRSELAGIGFDENEIRSFETRVYRLVQEKR